MLASPLRWILALSLGVTALACDRPPPVEAAAPEADAKAELAPTKGNEVTGTITFQETNGIVSVRGVLAGLKPGEHGFHIHEKGDCSCPDAECAGPHFSPKKAPHGAPTADERHAGDLGNVTANSDGKAVLETKDEMLKLEGAESIVGRAVVVHAKADDLKTQPSGNSGPRVACGVIEATPRKKG